MLKQKCKCILMSFFRNVIRVKNAIKKNFQMFFRSCLNTWYYDYNMNFSKCSAQSRVINSLTLHLGVSQMQNRLSDAAKTNPSPEGGPLNFGPRFERKKNRRRWVIYYFDEINTLDVSQWIQLDAIFYYLRRRMAWYTKHFTN